MAQSYSVLLDLGAETITFLGGELKRDTFDAEKISESIARTAPGIIPTLSRFYPIGLT